jgi:hypothetical protein
MNALPPEVLPARIGRYEVVGELARGSMGRVLRALDPNLERQVALKVLAPLHLASAEGEPEELRRRFLLEARAAGRLNHPGIVMVLDADTDPKTGSPYIAMELVEGRSLESLLSEHGRLPAARAVAIALQVARALAYAHGEGVIHRDVKPANILVSDRGAVKVSDFGIAKLATQSLTVPGYVLGSPFFMSPEQACGESVDARTDLFSLGAVLYRTLTGALPFSGDSIAAVTFKVVNSEPPRPRSLAPEIPPALEALIERALAKDPADRFEDGQRMTAALEAVARELDAEAPAAAGVRAAGGRESSEGSVPTTGEAGLDGGTVALGRPAPLPARVAAPRARRAALLGIAAAALLAGALAIVFAAREQGDGEREDGESAVAPLPVVESPAPAEPASPPAAPPPPPSASLHLVYNNRLASGSISVWVDGERVWSAEVSGPRNVIRRVTGRELRRTVQVPAGERTVEVRISGRAAMIDVDAASSIRGQFEADEARWLRVALNPLTDSLRLSWME